jgi:hypothetical protein
MTGVALLVVAWLFIADLIFQTDRWLEYLRHRSATLGETGWQPRYPVEGVASSSALILAEAAVLWVILTQVKKPFWIRTGATSLGMLVVGVFVGLLTFHTDAAPHEEFQVFWLLCMSVALAVLSLASGVAQIVRVRTDRSG